MTCDRETKKEIEREQGASYWLTGEVGGVYIGLWEELLRLAPLEEGSESLLVSPRRAALGSGVLHSALPGQDSPRPA